MGLYDSQRLQRPLADQQTSDWKTVDQKITATLERLRTDGGAVRLVTGTVISPTLQATIDSFLKSFQDARHVVWDAVSSSAILDAHAKTHGARVLPYYRFDQALVIVSLGARFSWDVDLACRIHGGLAYPTHADIGAPRDVLACAA